MAKKIKAVFVISFLMLANLSFLSSSKALTVQTNNGNTLVVNLAATRTLGATDTSADFDFSSNISRPSSGWSDTDLVAAEVAITSGTGETAGADNAPVFRDDSSCIVDLSNNINSNDFGSTQSGSVTISSNTVFVLNDRSPQLSVQGTIQAVINVLSRVRVQCSTASALVGKYVRVGVVPTISSTDCAVGNLAGTTATITCTDLYYVFSSQHYYRVAIASTGQTLTQHFARARTMTIPVDGTNKSGATRYGWVATLKDRDEIILTNAIDSGGRMIGTTDRTNTGANAWTWESNWGGSGTNCETDEGNFRWLGPDVWCERVPAWNHLNSTSYPSGTATTSRYWIRSNNLWEPTDLTAYNAHSGMRIDFASTVTPTTEADARDTNGYNVFHSWHTGANGAPDEPNSSGDYIYQGYSGANNNPGWDDTGESTGSERAAGSGAGQKFYVEYCSGTTNNTCIPPDAAVDSIQLKYDQTITLVTAPTEGASISTSTTTFNATTSSGLEITYSSSDTSICTVSSSTAASGSNVTISLISANANCTITISQAGNTNFNAATSITRAFLSLYGRVVNCSGVGSLQNGSFENLPVATSNVATQASNTTDYVWHGYVSPTYYTEPRQFLFLGAANSNKTTKISDWNSSIVGSDDGVNEGWIEIQRQISGYEQNGTFSSGAYYDRYNPSPAQGNYFAELNAKVVMGLYQDIATIPGTTIRWSIKHRGRSFTNGDVMKVKIGSTSSQSEQTSLQKKLQDTSSLWTMPTYANNSFVSVTTISDELDTGWSLYKGSYTIPSSQTTTRFIFESVSGAIGTSIGNYLDDIIFSPLIACPASFSVIKGRTTTINPFDLDGDGQTDTGDSYGWSDATVSDSNLFVSAGTATRTTIGGVANRGISYTAPNTTGTQTIDFTITNPEGDTSNSRLTINVIDDTAIRSLNTLPIDPQATTYNPKNMTITSGPTEVLACLNIASDNSGTLLDGVLRIDVGTIGSSDSTYSASGNTVTISNDRTSAVNLTGVIASVNTTLRTATITRVSGGRLSNTYYIRIRSVPTTTDLLNVSCDDAAASSSRTFKLQPMNVGRSRSVSVSLNKR